MIQLLTQQKNCFKSYLGILVVVIDECYFYNITHQKSTLIRLHIIWLGLAVVLQLNAQQPAQYSMFMNNMYTINPAYAGMEGSLIATGVYRTQWEGMPGNPTSRQVNVHTPFYRWNGGLGLNVENDRAGVHSHSQISASYNYVSVLPGNLIISSSLSLGLVQRTLDGTAIRTPGGIYGGGVIDHQDPRLPNTTETGFAPNVGAGVFAAYGPWEVGLSVHNMLNNTITVDSEFPGGYRFNRSFFLHAQYQYVIDSDWAVSPCVLLKTDLAQTQIDFGGQFVFQNQFSGGLAVRGYNNTSFDAVVFIGGVRLNDNFYLNYAYDATISRLRNASGGSHEIMLIYNLGRALGVGIPQKIIYNPRLL